VIKILVIGSVSHEGVDNIEWTTPFSGLEKYDCMIIDLASFPKDYPPTLFKNIGILKRTSRLFIRDNKEIFCIMDKPFKILFKEIPLNYAWMPFPQKLTVNPMLLGKTIKRVDEKFTDYIANVTKWDNELFWQDTENVSFDAIAVNKEENSIAATITMAERGKIHFLPRPTTMSTSETIKLLTELTTKKEKQENKVLNSKVTQELAQNEDVRNLFSAENKEITETVYMILKDWGITTTQNAKFDLTDLKGNLYVKVISTEGKVEAQNKVAKFIEKQRNKTKTVVIANTYKDLPPKSRANKQHLDAVMKLVFETNNSLFMTTLSLQNLYNKVNNGLISREEASTLIQNQTGEITI
jgi:hypothetical protein